MGLFTGSVSYMRFFVVGGDKENLKPDVMERALEARRFLPLVPSGDVMESAGWVPSEDPLNDDLAITRDLFIFGDIIVLSYREDKYAIPRAVLKQETKKRLDKIAADEKKPRDEMGRAFIKAVEAAVLSELKARSIPRTRIVQVMWDTKRNELRAFGSGSIVVERLASLLERTFQVRIEQATYPARACTLDLGAQAKILERLTPAWFFTGEADDGEGVSIPEMPLDPAPTVAKAEIKHLGDKSFLGPEFVTWMYFTLRREGFEVELDLPNSDGSVAFEIGNKAKLTPYDASATGATVALSGAGLDTNPEVLQAVKRGALLDLLSLRVAIQSRVYALTVKSDGSLTGVKLPDLFTEEEEEKEVGPQDEDAVTTIATSARKPRRPKLPLEDVLALRAQCMSEVEMVIDLLFASFLPRRVGKTWHSVDIADIRRQVVGGLKEQIAA